MAAASGATPTDCPVCYDTFTKQARKPVKCQYCDFTACVVCLKRYLTNGNLDAHCMECKRGWNDEFLDLNFTRAFRTGPWKKHREKVLMDREMSLLPTRQPRVEAKIKYREIGGQMRNLKQRLAELEDVKKDIQREYDRLYHLRTRFAAESRGDAPPAWTLDTDERGKPSGEKAKFIMKCPDADCRGFLSTTYKCGTCQRWACPDCLEIKGLEKEVAHTCSEERKASVQLILKESRPCPTCGMRISKVNGCDQMFCTDCHTAFSWTTGQKVNGVIHNPHYYEFLRKQGNGVAPRNEGDLPCGGVPYYYDIDRAIRNVSTKSARKIMYIHRIVAEVSDERILNYQGAFNIEDNGDLGVLYLMKEISEEQMRMELVKRETKALKGRAIRAVLEMFVNTGIMMLNAIVSSPPKTDAAFQTTLTEFRNLRNYVNESLMNISKQKNCSVPQIGSEEDDSWNWRPFNKVAPKKRAPAKKKAEEEEESESESESEEESVSAE